MTISGSGFSLATSVAFGPTPATSFIVNSDTSITAVSPVGTTGKVDVTVSSIGGSSVTSAADKFTYAPTVTGVSPTSGSAAGGTVVTLTGTNFTVATGVLFGPTAATGYTVNSNTSITATAPASISRDRRHHGDLLAGTSPTSAADHFSYLASASGLAPTSGPVGTAATISAAGFLPSHALTVTVGGQSATITSGGTTGVGGPPRSTSPCRTATRSGPSWSWCRTAPTPPPRPPTSPWSAPPPVSTRHRRCRLVGVGVGYGFLASHALTVTVGGQSAAITSGATTGATGSSSVTFTVPGLAVGSYQVVVSDGTDSVTVSPNLAVTVGSANKLVFSTQPAGAVDGVAFTTQPKVTVEDAGGNVVTSSTASITLSPSSAALACTTNPVNAVAGVATFAGCNLTGTTGSYTLTAASTGLTNGTSSSFTLSVGSASELAVTTNPAGAAYGIAFTTQPVVTIQDVGGNTVSSTASVTLAITTQPGTGATLTCTGGLSKAAVAGVATFSGCQITGIVGSYTLTATSSGLTSATTTFTLAPGTATHLVFTTQPAGAVDGVAFTTQPVVTVEDGGGNTVTGSSAPVTLTASSGTLSGCTAAVNASAGVATFANCAITGSTASSYTLTAASSGLTSATSNSFGLGIGGASKLVFTTQPAGAVDGIAFTTQPKVTVEDVGGNTVTTSTAPVTLAASGLSCTTNPVNAVAGVATFAGCSITGTIGTYSLTAASTGLTSATSSSFSVTIGAASAAVVTTDASGAAYGIAFTTQPVVPSRTSAGTR